MHARWCFVYMWYVTMSCATVGDAHMDLFNKHLYFSDGSPQQRGYHIYLCDLRIGIVFDSYLAHGNVYRAFPYKIIQSRRLGEASSTSPNNVTCYLYHSERPVYRVLCSYPKGRYGYVGSHEPLDRARGSGGDTRDVQKFDVVLSCYILYW